jgi:hypothetical protein
MIQVKLTRKSYKSLNRIVVKDNYIIRYEFSTGLANELSYTSWWAVRKRVFECMSQYSLATGGENLIIVEEQAEKHIL